MTEQELYRIASSKPVLTDYEVMDDITEYDIEVMTDSAWLKSQEIASAKITEAEDANDWITLEEFSEN